MTAIDLVALDATSLAEKVRCREISARRLLEATISRIDELDPRVNAFRVVLREQALSEVDRVDALSDAELAERPLAGVPVAIKDDTDVAGQSTMWGSAANRLVRQGDARIVARLRSAGAVVIGKTNVPCSQQCTGTASTFANAIPGATSFLVELPGSSQVTAAMVRTHANALLTIAVM